METPKFPSEILLQILRYVDRRTLKSLRQCSQWLETQATPVLFRELVVVPYLTSFQGLVKYLASNPCIRDAVERIRYDTHCVGPEAFKLSDASYMTTHAWSKDVQRLSHNYPGFAEYMTSLHPDRFPLSMSDDFRKLIQLSPQGKLKIDHMCEMNDFTALLEAFPKVTSVALTNGVLSNDTWFRSKIRPVPYFYGKWFDSHKRDKSIPDLNLLSKPYTTTSSYVASQRAEFLLLSLCNHNNRFFELEIDNVHGYIFTGRYAAENVRNKWDNDCLRNVASLKLEFHEPSDHEYRYREDYYTLARLLTQNQIMQELSIVFHDPTDGVQHLMSEIKEIHVVPPLQCLTLGRATLSGRDLVEVLKLMSPTLRKVKLDHIFLHDRMGVAAPYDCWLHVIKSMNEQLKLEDVNFSGVLKAHNQHLIVPDWEHAQMLWQFKKARRIASDDVRRLSQILKEELYEYLSALNFDDGKVFTQDGCLSNQINRYITHQGSYPPELAEVEKAAAAAAQADASPNWSVCYGDCSWLVGVY